MSASFIEAHRVPLPLPRPLRLAVILAVGAGLLSMATARAAAIDPARVRVSPALIDDAIRGLLPVDVVLPGPIGGSTDAGVTSTVVVAAITELRYCGVTDRGAGHFRAVIRSGPLGGAGAPILVGEDGCRQPLGDLARRMTAQPPGADGGAASVADIEALWRPWELRLILVRTNAPAPPRPGPPQPLGVAAEGREGLGEVLRGPRMQRAREYGDTLLGVLETRQELLVISTAGFRIATGTGEPIILHAAPAFAADSVEVLAVWGEGGSAPPAARPPVGGGTAPPLTAGGNAFAELPFGFVNQLLRHVTGAQPLPIRLDRDVVDLQNLSTTGSGSAPGAGVTVMGFATPRSLRETVRVTVLTGGSELRVISVRADAQQENCSGLGTLATVGCNARNAARNAAASAFATAATQKYQGQFVRDLAGAQELRVELGARRLQLGGAVSHLGPTARGFAIGTRLTAGGSDH